MREIQQHVLSAYSNVAYAAIGGSSAHGYHTITSDVDVFLLLDGDPVAVSNYFPANKVDIEVRTIEWFLAFVEQLEAEPFSVGEVGYSGSFQDLRFCLRLVDGAEISADHKAREAVLNSAAIVRRWSIVYLSGAYVNLYQDLVGYYLGGRLDEFYLSAGLLIQRAVHLALSRFGIFDLSAKPAFLLLEKYGTDNHKLIFAILQKLLFRLPNNENAFAILVGCNAIIASTDFFIANRNHDELNDDELCCKSCFLGLPRYRIIFEVVTGEVMVYSEAYAQRYLWLVWRILAQI